MTMKKTLPMTNNMLITGAAQRIGAALAEEMAAEGWHVCIHYNASQAQAEKVADAIISKGGKASIFHANLAAAEGPENLIIQCQDEIGPLSCLINNASIFEYDDVDSLNGEMLDLHHAVNVRAPLLLSQAFSKRIPKNVTCNIVNILDNKVMAPNPDYMSYTLSKFALKGATEILAMAMAPQIRVNGIAPGITLLSGKQSKFRFNKAHKTNPLKQGCTPGQIAAALKLILDCPSMTGEIIVLDGGQKLQHLPRDIAFLT